MAIAVGEEPQEHEDWSCHYCTGSSKAMKVTATLDLVIQLHALGINT